MEVNMPINFLLIALGLVGCGEKEPTDDSAVANDTAPVVTDDSGVDDSGSSGVSEYIDEDGDGYGLEACHYEGCGVAIGNDCDDYDETIYPNAEEVCDGVDNDCDGLIDDEDDGVVIPDETDYIWYLDSDADGYGDSEYFDYACDVDSLEDDYVSEDGDCDDLNDEIHPDAEEICNDGLDNNCNGDDSECSFPEETASDDASVVFTGINNAEEAGRVVANIGDYNGDGIDDMAIASKNGEGGEDAGVVYVVYGSESLSGTISLADADMTIRGFTEDAFGTSVARAGDIDGDGLDDFMVGAADDGVSHHNGGAVYFFFSSSAHSGEFDLESADFSIHGTDEEQRVGSAVTSVGDIDGDGYDDVLIGAERYSRSGDDFSNSRDIYDRASGGVFTFTSNTIIGSVTSGQRALTLDDSDGYILGSALSGGDGLGSDFAQPHQGQLGDINGDGVEDVLVSALQYGSCAIYTSDSYSTQSCDGAIFSFPVTSLLTYTDLDVSSPEHTFYGTDPGDRAVKVASHQDLDGDGYDDLVIGAYLADHSTFGKDGEAYVIYGSPALASSLDLFYADGTLLGQSAGNFLGHSVAIGDVDGDGYPEAIIGESGADAHDPSRDIGYTFMFSSGFTGSTSLSYRDYELYGPHTFSAFGESSAVGDFNGDGTDDVIIGIPANNSYGPGRGGAALAFGQSI